MALLLATTLLRHLAVTLALHDCTNSVFVVVLYFFSDQRKKSPPPVAPKRRETYCLFYPYTLCILF